MREQEGFDQNVIISAATIDERLSSNFRTVPGSESDYHCAAQRLAAWCKTSAAGDWELFKRRLARDNYSFQFVRSRLGAIELVDSPNLPQWVADATWILDITAQIELRSLQRSGIYPFEELLAPLVQACSNKCWKDLGYEKPEWFALSAKRNLTDELLSRVSALFSVHLYRDYEKFRSNVIHSSTSVKELSPFSTEVYERFVSFMATEGLKQLFVNKPVLLRLIATVVRQWLDATTEFVNRLDKDFSTICRELGNANGMKPVVRIDSGLSDLHHGGRSVKAVTLTDGTQFIYKPRCVEVERRWCELVAYLNSSGSPIDLRSPNVISMEDYGWVEYVDDVQMTGDQSAASYYRRAGGLLSLFHVLCATDMHDENLIACGEYPIAVDLEMLMQPAVAWLGKDDVAMRAHAAAAKKIQDSVASIGMLPSLARVGVGRVIRLGGLEEESGSTSFVGWVYANSDAMRPERKTYSPEQPKNVPRRNGKSVRFDTYIEEFVCGFLQYSEFLLKTKEGYPEAVTDIIERFNGIEVRRIHHPTRFYDLVLKRLRTHKRMDDGAIWSADADFVARFAEWDQEVDHMWSLREHERTDLLNLNVPRFTVTTKSNVVHNNKRPVCALPDTPGIERARRRFENLSCEDLKWQEMVIRQSSESTLHVGSLRRGTAEYSRPELQSNGPALAAEEGLETARELFRSIHGAAIRKGTGAAWLGLDWVGDSEICSLSVLGPDLYNGMCGISVFCAALGKVANAQLATNLALSCLESIRSTLSGSSAARSARALGLGAGTGLGSVIYALCLTSELTGRRELLDDAIQAAELMSKKLIDSDRVLDVLGGSAGAILGLLRLYREVEETSILDRAVRCGDHLLSQPRIGMPGCRSWPSTGHGETALTGMSHGAAGFALSLGSLFMASGEERFFQAAMDCVRYENSTYDRTAQNWPDLRDSRGSLFLSQWCHGAVGIGLSRVSLLKIPDIAKSAMKSDIERACVANDLSWPQRSDTMCCGTLGSVELLRAAGEVLDDGQLSLRAERQLAAVTRAAYRTDYQWQIGRTEFNVGLFRGQAGVGYSILRGIDAELPNILVWE